MDSACINGLVRNWGFANAHRDKDCNPLVPIGDSFPLFYDEEHLGIIKDEISRAISELGFRNGPVNVELVFDESDRPIIVELGPRSGGGLLADLIELGTGERIISYCIRCALGDKLDDVSDKPFQRFLSVYLFHSKRAGIFERLQISNNLEHHIINLDMFVKQGDRVYPCSDSSKAVGIAILEWESSAEMIEMMDNMNEFYKVDLKHL